MPHLTAMLGDQDPELVMFALQSLARIGDPPAAPADPAAVCSIPIPTSPRRRSRRWASCGCGRRCPRCCDLLDGELWLQLAAIDALGAIGDPEAVGPLMALVPDSVLAEPAVQALRRIAAPGVAGAAAGLLPVVRERALRDPLLLAVGRGDRSASRSRATARRAPGARAGGLRDARRAICGRCWARSRRDDRRARRAKSPARGGDAGGGGRASQRWSRCCSRGSRRARAPQWLEGLFRRFPDAPRRASDAAPRRPDPDVRRGALRAAPVSEEEELPALLELLEDPQLRRCARRRAAPWAAWSSSAPRRCSPSGSAGGARRSRRRRRTASDAALGGRSGRARELPRARDRRGGDGPRPERAGRPAVAAVRGRASSRWPRSPVPPSGGPALRAAAGCPDRGPR